MSKQDKAALRYLETKGITNYNDKMRMIGSLKHDVPNLRLNKGKFVTAGLRLYYNYELTNYDSITTFNRVLKTISMGNHSNEYDYNLNGLSLDELNTKYAEAEKLDVDNDRERSNNRVFIGNSEYTIVPIETYEEARKYSDYTSWCVTQGDDAFEQFTKGGQRFYFCYKDRFEQVPKDNNGAPLNEYGLSLISVLIDMEGNLDTITTRYNHEYNGENNEGLRNTEQLEDILNVGFYKIFIPYTREELHERGVILFDEVQPLLDYGVDPYLIFDKIREEYEGFRVVKINGKYNYLDGKNKLLSPYKWFQDANKFVEGFGIVSLNNKRNFIDKHGKYLINQWFYNVSFFGNGTALVILNEENMATKIIDKNGNFVKFDIQFNRCFNISEGYISIERDDKWNFIDVEGKLLFPDQWFEEVNCFISGHASIKLNGKWNIIDKNKNILMPNWFDNIYEEENFFIAVNDKKVQFFKYDGKLVTNQSFDNMVKIDKNIFKVKLNNKWNIINENFEYVLPEWFDHIYLFDGYCTFENENDKPSIINYKNEIVSYKQYDDIFYCCLSNFCTVYLNNKYNFVNINNGELLSEQWFDHIKNSENIIKATVDDKVLYIMKNGKILNEKPIIPTLYA